MEYRSTRGGAKDMSFEGAVLEGLATDGGLYIPKTIPKVPLDEIISWANLPFPKLAFNIFRRFVATEEIPDADLQDILNRSFGTFSTPDVTPLKRLPISSPSCLRSRSRCDVRPEKTPRRRSTPCGP